MLVMGELIPGLLTALLNGVPQFLLTESSQMSFDYFLSGC